jgi:hemoglobin-like flavoprotein
MKLSIHPLTDPIPASLDGGAQIDQRLIYRLRVSLASLLAKGDELSLTFYRILFDRHPEVRPLFPKDMTAQREKLSRTLAWIVTYLDSHDEVLAAIRDLGRRHVGYGAKAEHYPFVRDALIEAMGVTAGKDWTADLAGDWRLSIDMIARHMYHAGEASSAPAAAKPASPTSTTPR